MLIALVKKEIDCNNKYLKLTKKVRVAQCLSHKETLYIALQQRI